jgi:hypothetical protein
VLNRLQEKLDRATEDERNAGQDERHIAVEKDQQFVLSSSLGPRTGQVRFNQGVQRLLSSRTARTVAYGKAFG